MVLGLIIIIRYLVVLVLKAQLIIPVNNLHLFAGEAVMVTLDIPAGVCGGVVDRLSGRSFA